MASSDADQRASSSGPLANLATLLNGALQNLLSQSGRILPDIGILQGIGQTVLTGGVVDDRKYLIENVVQVAASLPNGSELRNDLSGEFIKNLWKNLQHPPISYLGDEFKYRTADGSNNNIMYPHLGAAGSHYARSVVTQHPRTRALPDASRIFDSLFARDGLAKEHPSKVSSTLFYLATIIIHDLFHTDEQDMTKVKNSSYLDLGPLYGHNEDEQRQVRTFKDGLLKKDTFSEGRLLGQPPGVCALIIAFNRFHNYVVGEIANINEGGRFDPPKENSPGYEEALLKRDNDLFQTGRLITCGLYVNMILNDYLRTILNLNRNPVKSDWKLDPRESLNNVFDPQGTPRGIGNQVSAEFNMIYRWHSAISGHDEVWANDFMREVFGPHIDPSTLTVDEFLAGIAKWSKSQPKDPSQWTFGGLNRQADGRFEDAELVHLLAVGTENVAGAFGARNVPRILKAIEMLGVQQGRDWGLATLNEFRLFFKLKPYSTFAEVNSDPSVAKALEALYGHPDNIELYAGLGTEEAKKPFCPGSGLCPPFTTSFAILSDAVALVRGDRFYAVDYSPATLTNFGFAAASSDFDVAGGGVMYKLLLRAFPGWYRANSVYALYPFTTPEGNREIVQQYGSAIELDFSKPAYIPPPTPVNTWQGAVDVLSDQNRFKVPWGEHTFQLTHHDHMLSGDSAANAEQRVFVKECLSKPKHGLDEVRRFYESVTASLIRQHSHKICGSCELDIVRDVGNLAHANFVAHFFGIPLQGAGGGPDSYTDRELSDTLADLFGYVFLDLDTAKSYKHRVMATRETKRLGDVMQLSVANVKAERFPILRHMLGMGSSDPVLPDYGTHLVSRLFDGGKSVDEVVWTIIPIAAAASATQAQGWAQMIDLYLSDNYYSHWTAIQKLAQSDEPEAFEKLKKYALEGFRLSTPAFGVLRTVAVDKAAIKDGSRDIPVQKGDTLFVDFITAGRDPSKFPDPEEIKLDRPDDFYIHHGWGPHACLGRPIVTVAGASMLRTFARLGNLRRAPGAAGEMKSKMVGGAFKVFLTEDESDWSSFPCTKKVVFDDSKAEVPAANGNSG